MMTRKKATATAALIGALFLSTASFADASGEGDASLYERLGGLAPISVVVSDFLDALIPDPELNRNPAIDAARKRVPAPYLKYQLTAFMCMATGGPCGYPGRGMRESHAHLDITVQEWDRMVAVLEEVLATHGVPERETRELLELIGTTKDAIVIGS